MKPGNRHFFIMSTVLNPAEFILGDSKGNQKSFYLWKGFFYYAKGGGRVSQSVLLRTISCIALVCRKLLATIVVSQLL